jgi:putative Mg2+ transporter-C (MgtC) family protein
MNPHFTWHDIILRLALTVVAAGLIGFDRDERGRAAGLRTNLLVGLAACIAMMQTNALMISVGKAPDSFVVMDTMRLPLGILSGIGFIGAGAIIRRGEMITGVTTAATLWFVTVMGLCFGGGQIALGIWAFALGFATVFGLRKLETRMPRQHQGTLRVSVLENGPGEIEIETMLQNAGVQAESVSIGYDTQARPTKTWGWKIHWKAKRDDHSPPAVIRQLARNPEIQQLDFTTR